MVWDDRDLMKLASWVCDVGRLKPVFERVEWDGEAESGVLVMKVMSESCRMKMSWHTATESPNWLS